MKLKDALGILLITAIGVGIFSFFGGFCFVFSELFCESYADLMDEFAEDYYELGAYDEAMKARNEATEIRDTAREYHDYGIYSIVGALLIVIAGASWMAWRWGKDMSIEKH